MPEIIAWVCDGQIFCPKCAQSFEDFNDQDDTWSPVFDGAEADCISVCDECADIIEGFVLTDFGIWYTVEQIVRAIERGDIDSARYLYNIAREYDIDRDIVEYLLG